MPRLHTHSSPALSASVGCPLAGLARFDSNVAAYFYASTAPSLRVLHHTYLRFGATASEYLSVSVKALPWPVGSGALVRTISIKSRGMGMVVAQMSVGMLSIYVWKYGTHFDHDPLACHDLISVSDTLKSQKS